MKKTKLWKTLALVLAGVMTCGAMAGCGESTDQAGSGQQVSEKTDQQSEEAGTELAAAEPEDVNAEHYTIDFYYINYGSPLNDLEDVQAAMSEILNEKINADIVLHPIDSGAWGDKVNLMYVSQDKIDVICSSAGLSPDYATSVSKNAFLEIEDLLEQYGQDIIEACGEDFIAGTTMNGHLYGIPVLKEKGMGSGFIFNKELVEKYGFDLSTVKTYRDIEPMLEVIKENEPDITPLCFSGRNVISLRGAVDKFTGEALLPFDTEDFQIIPWYEYEPELELLHWGRDMYTAGYVNKSSLTDTDEGPMKVGKAFCMPYELHPGKAGELSNAWGIELEAVMINEAISPCTQAMGIMSSIGRTSENPERVMQFLNLLYTDKELLNTLVFGVEGKDYVKVSDDIITYPEGITAETVGYANQGWLFGNQFNNYLRDTEDPEKWNYYRELNDSIRLSPVMGFTFDSSEFSTELAALATVSNQYYKALYTGSVDVDSTVEEYAAKCKEAGIEKIYAECQRQLDEWRAANGK